MPTDQHREAEPDRPQPGAGGHVELLGDLDWPRAFMLLTGGVPQSHVDLDDPRHLELEYVRRLGHVLDLAAPAATPLRVLHLGGGALTLARYVAATRPGSRQLAAESDAEIVSLVRRRLPLSGRAAAEPTRALRKALSGRAAAEPTRALRKALSGRAAAEPTRALRKALSEPGRITVRVADARAVLEQAQAGSFDVVVADAFAGPRTPAHLTSAEFTAAAARALAPSGIYAANIGDGPPLAHARGRVAAVRAVFRYACVIADAAVLRGSAFGNLVVAAAGHELPLAELAARAAADPCPARVIAGAALERFVGGAEPITDARPGPAPAPPPDVYA